MVFSTHGREKTELSIISESNKSMCRFDGMKWNIWRPTVNWVYHLRFRTFAVMQEIKVNSY